MDGVFPLCPPLIYVATSFKPSQYYHKLLLADGMIYTHEYCYSPISYWVGISIIIWYCDQFNGNIVRHSLPRDPSARGENVYEAIPI